MGSDHLATRRSVSPEDAARLIAKRPGMHLGAASYERAIGFLHGVAALAAMRRSSRPSPETSRDGFSAGDGSSLLGRIAVLRRDPDVEVREAILALEPLLAEALAELQALDEA